MGEHHGGDHRARRSPRARVLLGVAAVVALALLVTGVTLALRDDDGHRRVSILPLGDSITFGSTAATTQTPGGYRGVLDRLLSDAGVEHTFVGTTSANPPLTDDAARFRHDGWPGSRVEELDEALTGASRLGGGSWLTDDDLPLRPDVVVLMAGTNDVRQHYDPGATFPGGFSPRDPDDVARFVADLTRRLEHLVATLRTHVPDLSLVLCTIPPMRERTAAAYNDAIRRMVPRLRLSGLPVQLADVEQALDGDPTLIGPDHIHPTADGYARVAAAIAPAVERLARS